MTRKLPFLILALFALISGPGWGQEETSLFKETWGDYTGAVSSYTFSGTTTYDNQTNYLSYAVDNTNDKVESATAGSITSNNLFFYKSAASNFTISGIKLQGATELTLSFLTNGTNFAVSYTIDNGTEETLLSSCSKGANTKSFTIDGGTSISLKFKKTGTSANNRLDDIELKGILASSTDPTITCADITDVPYEGVSNATAAVTFNNAEGWNPSVTCDGDVVTAASLSENTITYSVSENTGSTDREGSFTITLSKEGEIDITKVVSVTQKHFVVDYAELPFSYDDGKSNLPVGLTQSGLGSDYSSSPKMKFDDTGDYLILKINENPGTLTFKIKGNSLSGNYVFKLQVSTDGTNFTDKKSYTSISSTTTTETIADLDASVRYIKWIYTTKANGNVALGDINLAKEGVKIPTFSIEGGNYWANQSVALSQADSKPIYYTTNDNDPTTNGTLYSEAISVTSTCTIKAAAQDGTEWSDVVSATYKIAQTYGSVAAVNAITENDIPIIVLMNNWTITSISGNDMYVTDGTTDNPTIHIYDYYIPSDYMVGGKLSGSLKAVWTTSYDGEVTTIQNWDGINYSAPTFTINIDEDLENGTIVATPTTATAGTGISFSVTPDEGYRMTAESLIVMDATGEEVEISGNNPYTFIMPASNVTISAEFELIPTMTFSYLYSINGVDNTVVVVAEGTVITLEDGTDIDDNFTFAGWTIDESNVDNIFTAGTNYTINEDVTFYAVYAREESCSNQCSGNYEKVTAQLTDWRGDYLIAYSDEVFMDGSLAGGTNGVGKAQTHVSPESELSENTISAAWGDEYYVTIEAIDDADLTKGYVIKSHSTTTPYFYQTSNSNGMACTENKSTAATYPITITLNTENDVRIALGGKATGAVLRYNNNSGSTGEMFRYYKNCGQQPIYLYKKSTGTPGVTKYYTRVFLDETAIASITIGGPSIIPAGSTLNMGTRTLTSETAANLVIEEGGQLIHSSENVNATFQKSINGYTGTNDHYYLIANPTDNTTVANLTNENGYDLYTFNPAGDEQGREWINEKANPLVESEKGYLYANSGATTTLEFAGKLTPAGSTDINLNYANKEFGGFNLIGNPYACNAYVQNYSFYTIEGDAVVAGTGAIAPCQGFMIETDEDKVAVELTTQAPEPAAAPSAMSIEVNQNRGNVIDRAIVRFDGANDMHKFMLNPDRTNIRLAKNGEEFAAVSTEAEGELPVNFKAEKNGTYTITVNTENVEANYLHLIDNLTGMDTDLLSTSSYTFDAKTSDYASRFKLVFGVKNENTEAELNNFAYISNGEIVISNEGRATLQVIDVLGRIVSSEEINGECRISTNGLTAGLYILNLNGMTQKIVVR